MCRRRGQQSLFTWCINTVLVNSYLLNYHSNVPNKKRYINQDLFRTALIAQCFTIEKTRKRKKVPSTAVLPNIDTEALHNLTRREIQQDCVVCKGDIKKELHTEKQRRVLGEISVNAKRNRQRKCTVFGCDICDTPLCKESTCWERFHSQKVVE